MDVIEILGNLDPNFTHLHVHTIFSFLDGYNHPKKAAKRAKELGMTHLACTDHNHIGAALDFQKACKEEGIFPILGCEMYWTWDTNILRLPAEERYEMALKAADDAGVEFPKKAKKSDINDLIAPFSYDTKQYHIILLAQNQTGWQNLVKLQSLAAEKCTFNGRYCCDDEMLRAHSEGLIMTTACIGNAVPNLITKGETDKALNQLLAWKDIFKDRFYVEIQPLNIPEQRLVNLQLIQWANEYNINIIATTDAHYTLESDWDDHDTLLCIGIGKKKDDEDRMRYSNDFWLKSYEEMIETFSIQADDILLEYGDFMSKEAYMETIRTALENTNTIANSIKSIKLGSDVDLFPNLEIPAPLTAEAWLTTQCFQNLYKYKKENSEIELTIYERRLHEELNIINTKGFAPYILVVQDYIEWANTHGCPTGPGRGSGAGSLVLFLLGITKVIDPIKYNLLFFRFLTMDRTAPPDIDTDFEYYGRDSVIKYLEDKYGSECVSHIGTYTEMGVKSGLKDVGRVLDIDFGLMNTITKKVEEWSDRPDLEFKHLDKLKESDRPNEQAAYREFKEYEETYPELFRLARAFEGTKRNAGVHASGILITPMAVNDLFPTRVDKEGTRITLYTGPELEELKAIKFDILGLKTLSVIKQTLEAIDKDLTFDDLYREVNINDPDMFKMIQSKATEGLFQIESNLFKGMIEEILPTTMNDIVVINALGRPGPISAGMPKSYALRKNGFEVAVEPLANTWDIVEDTHGTIAYQEQIMLIAKRVACFDDNQADSYLRKAFAKKKKDKMAQCKQWFIYGKLNEEAPEDYDNENKAQPEYDPKGKHGPAILGGIANGYAQEELEAFWTNIEGFADYLFNKSHAACYAYICILTAYLKKYYPAKFIASLLSVQEKEEKIDLYSKVARKMGIEVKVPDLNLSGIDFREVNGDILYGLRSIKGVGESSIPAIIENRPYTCLSDALDKIEKKYFNKRVGMALVKAGAFDFYNTNRNIVINEFYNLRADKDERLNPDSYTEDTCMNYEKEVLGTTITFMPFWDEVVENETIVVEMKMNKVQEKRDRNGNMMAFVEGIISGSSVRAVIFSKTYCNNVDKFDLSRYSNVILKGKKDDKGAFVVSSVLSELPKEKTKAKKKPSCIDADFDAEIEERFAGII